MCSYEVLGKKNVAFANGFLLVIFSFFFFLRYKIW